VRVEVGIYGLDLKRVKSDAEMLVDLRRAAAPEPAPVGRRLYFSARDSDGNDAELWRSDGTSAGTKLVKEFVPGPDGGFPGPLVNIGGTLYFGARDLAHGAEPWTLRKRR
jgi:ELWxxDGT repeat protein